MATTGDLTEPAQPSASTPTLAVTISPNRLSVHLTVAAPSPDSAAKLPTVEQALAHLAEANVTSGIDAACVATAVAHPGERVLVAVGQGPRHGENGRVECVPTLLAVGGRPHVSDDGQVSLFDLDLLHNVADGAILATVIPPTMGAAGINVYGQSIAARPGRAARLRVGPGTRLSPDGLRVLATTAGHALLVGEVISVSAIYHVRGDLGPATGHLDFVGSVSIAGNVDRGFRVKAGGDVEIQGSMAGGDVEAGGSVSVRYGIQGHNGHGRVVAAGSVRAKFIEFASVRAGGNVYAADGIMRSEVEAGGSVEVLGGHGAIVGGTVLAHGSVSARDLGSAHGIRTHIAAGNAPALQAETQHVRTCIQTLNRQVDQVQQRLANLQAQQRQARLTAVGRDELEKFHAVYRALLDQRIQLAAREQELVDVHHALRGATLVAHGTCHAEVEVAICGAIHHVDKPHRGVRFERNQETDHIQMVRLSGPGSHSAGSTR